MDAVAITEHFTNILRGLVAGVVRTPTPENIEAARYMIEQSRIACDECTAQINEASRKPANVERSKAGDSATQKEAKNQMNPFIETFLQFFPACCMFVALAVIVSDEWKKENRAEKAKLRALMIGPGADTRPRQYLKVGYPWKSKDWGRYDV